MAFKMKGFPMHNSASALKQTSPMKQEVVATTEPVEEPVVKEPVVVEEEKVNPHGSSKTSHQAQIWDAINVGDPKENLALYSKHMSKGNYDDMPKAKKNAQRVINALRRHMELQGDYSWKEGYNF